MSAIYLVLIGALAILLIARAIVGPGSGSQAADPVAAEEPPADGEDLWTVDALARLGTPETVEDLVASGRADELRGLGYEGLQDDAER